MKLFHPTHYRSDITLFLQEMQKKDPTLFNRQFEGRERLWDKPLNEEAWSGFRKSQIPFQTIPYI